MTCGPWRLPATAVRIGIKSNPERKVSNKRSFIPRGARLLIILLLASLLYALGAVRESMIILGLGAVFEMAFWIGLFKRSNT